MKEQKYPIDIGDDVYIIADFEGNLIFARRMRGNKEPENKVLGAILMDKNQLEILSSMIDFVKKNINVEPAGKEYLEYFDSLVKNIYWFSSNVEVNQS